MQAILITAYTEWDLLLRLVGKFDNSFNIYIHIDAKVLAVSLKARSHKCIIASTCLIPPQLTLYT